MVKNLNDLFFAGAGTGSTVGLGRPRYWIGGKCPQGCKSGKKKPPAHKQGTGGEVLTVLSFR